jgi:hypothetical protein
MNLSASCGDPRVMPYEKEGDTMMIVVALAAAMTLAMLIATAVALHQETQRDELERKRVRAERNRF